MKDRHPLLLFLVVVGSLSLGCDLVGGVTRPTNVVQPDRTPSAVTPEPTVTSSEPPAAGTCPEAVLVDPPAGSGERDRVVVPSGSDPAGLLVTMSDPSDREFSILSGIAGELGGTEILAPTNVRGHVATVSFNRASDTYFAFWQEAPLDSPCSQYRAIGTGFSEREFRTYVEGIR